MPKPLWTNVDRVSMRDVLFGFKGYFPWVDHSKLNVQTMRQVLAGELVIIKMGGRNRFELWPGKNFKSQLQRWNKRVAIPCVHIPAVNGKDTVEKQAKKYGLTEPLELVGEGPRSI